MTGPMVYVGGVRWATGPLNSAAKTRLAELPAVMAEHDGWETATAAALRFLDNYTTVPVNLVSGWSIRVPSHWILQPRCLVEARWLCPSAIWLGPPSSQPWEAEVIWPCFSDPTNRRNSVRDIDFDPERPDFSGLGEDHPTRWS